MSCLDGLRDANGDDEDGRLSRQWSCAPLLLFQFSSRKAKSLEHDTILLLCLEVFQFEGSFAVLKLLE